MKREWFTRIIEVTTITIAMAAIFQELEKPKEDRTWHGTIAKFIPYDFRLPTIDRLRESYWNPYTSRIITPEVFGIGWAINFYALLERLSLIRQATVTEQDFLMPTQRIKDLLT